MQRAGSPVSRAYGKKDHQHGRINKILDPELNSTKLSIVMSRIENVLLSLFPLDRFQHQAIHIQTMDEA